MTLWHKERNLSSSWYWINVVEMLLIIKTDRRELNTYIETLAVSRFSSDDAMGVWIFSGTGRIMRLDSGRCRKSSGLVTTILYVYGWILDGNDSICNLVQNLVVTTHEARLQAWLAYVMFWLLDKVTGKAYEWLESVEQKKKKRNRES